MKYSVPCKHVGKSGVEDGYVVNCAGDWSLCSVGRAFIVLFFF